jgi:hypothetical protein
MEEGLWYVRREGRVTGPITGLDVRAGIAARRLQPDVELSKDKVTWVAATEVPGLVGPSTPGAPAPAPGGRRGQPPLPLRPSRIGRRPSPAALTACSHPIPPGDGRAHDRTARA